MSEYRITLRVKHEPSVNELQLLRDRIRGWCDEFCLEREELSIRTPTNHKEERLWEAMEK